MRLKLSLLFVFLFLLSPVVAGEFDWRQCSGQTLKVMLVQHPYAEGILKKIAEFEQATGIRIEQNVIPEENYMDKLATSISSRSGEPDVFMAGPYQAWEYAPSDFIADLDPFIADARLTSPDYDVDDFFEGIIGAMRWDKISGHKVGSGNLWGIPLGFEFNCISYNKDLFAERGIAVPTTTEELYQVGKMLNKFDGEGTYGIAVRGTRNWGTITTGYLSTFANYGAIDMEVENGRLVSRLDSPEAVRMTDDWVNMIRDAGSPTWSSYTWYQCAADLGARKAAILIDADILGYFSNVEGGSNQSGKLASAPGVMPADRSGQIAANLWTWALSMNNDSRVKDAAWLFIQYFTGKEFQTFSVVDWKSVDSPRKSVFNNPAVQRNLAKMDGYIDMFNKTVPGATILFTPNPHHFEIATEWTSGLQDIVAGKYPTTEDGMKALKKKIDVILEDVEIE